jgi:mono/diheme cytochrome c family protein
MPRSTFALTAAAALFCASLGAALLTAQTPPAGTVWDGAFTDAQATRAMSAFAANCSECHVLGGSGDGQLVGQSFWEGYSQKTVGDLLTFVRTNMPSGAEGSLSPSMYADLVALILRSNGLPAGGTELSAAASGHLKIIPKDGSSALPANSLARIVGCLTKAAATGCSRTPLAPRADRRPRRGKDAHSPPGHRENHAQIRAHRLARSFGQRMSASGILIGTGGHGWANVSVR